MLKAEIIRFEAEDIITASGGTAAAPGGTVIQSCTNSSGHNMKFTNVDGTWQMVCTDCGNLGPVSGGTVTVDPNK